MEEFQSIVFYKLSPEDTLRTLGVNAQIGLTDDEVALRYAKYGTNEIPAGKKISFWQKLWNELNSVLIYVLLVGAALSFAFQHIVDGIVILGVIVINVSVSLYMERKAESTSDKLKALMSPTALVLRNDEKVVLQSSALTVGDIVLLQAGDIVPADGRVIAATDLNVLEAALTGESHAIVKVSPALSGHEESVPIAERTCMVFSGTQVLKGTAQVAITGIGKNSEIGKISALLSAVSVQKTPLMLQLEVFGQYLSISIISLALIALGVALGRSYSVDDAFAFAIGIAVAAIPEGLPSIVTITFAVGVNFMALKGAIIKSLPAVETLGSVSVICSDKTGTLTVNIMTVKAIYSSKGLVEITDDGLVDSSRGLQLSHEEAVGFLFPGLLCNDAEVKISGAVETSEVSNIAVGQAAAAGEVAQNENAEESTDPFYVQGDPTESCILTVAAKLLTPNRTDNRSGDTTTEILGAKAVQKERRKYGRLAEIPFDSATKYMATMHELSAADCQKWLGLSSVTTPSVRIICLKGAPERVIGLTPQPHAAWLSQADALAARGMRVLGLAFKIVEPSAPAFTTDALTEADIFQHGVFTMSCLAGIIDPPRAEAIVAVKYAQEAGMAVKMITGDHPTTALAIGKQLGIHNNPDFVSCGGTAATMKAITGNDLDKALAEDTTATFDDIVIQNNVFARTSPEHKLQIVQSLQRQNVICSMTGDGVNDAPALKAANIGVAMGITGTGVAKDAAKMIITDDNFATIVDAVRIGRCTYHNLIKVLAFVLPTNGGQAFSIVMALIINIEVPITALQILWVNMVTSITLGMVLAFEEPHPEIMHAPPRRSDKPVFGRFLAWRLLFVTAVLVCAVLGNYAWEKIDNPDYSVDKLRTIAVNTLSVCQITYLFSCRFLRSLATPYAIFCENPLQIWLGVLAVAILQAVFTYAPPFQFIFKTEAMDGVAWGKCLVFGVATFIAVELEKFIAHNTFDLRDRFWSWLCGGYSSNDSAGYRPAADGDASQLTSGALEMKDRLDLEEGKVAVGDLEDQKYEDNKKLIHGQLPGRTSRAMSSASESHHRIPYEEL